MQQFFEKWSDRLIGHLMDGDYLAITNATGVEYHRVRRMLRTGRSKDEKEIELVFTKAQEIIQQRSVASIAAVEAFGTELNFEYQLRAAKAQKEADLRLRAEQREDLVNM